MALAANLKAKEANREKGMMEIDLLRQVNIEKLLKVFILASQTI